MYIFNPVCCLLAIEVLPISGQSPLTEVSVSGSPIFTEVRYITKLNQHYTVTEE